MATSLPVYHIDTYVLLPSNDEQNIIARRVMKGAESKYILKVSVLALGECLLKILTDNRFKEDIMEDDGVRRSRPLTRIEELIEEDIVQICSPRDDWHQYIEGIKGCGDNQLRYKHPTDISLISIAMTEEANGFITADRDILRSRNLKSYVAGVCPGLEILDAEDAPNFR